MTGLTVFSINGYMGDMWSGPQAEVARHLSDQDLNLAYWQPIGYQDTDFPLSGGVTSGLASFQDQRRQHPGPYVATAWSEGAIILTLAVKAEIAAGNTDCKAAVTYGNPYRGAGQWAPNHGIGAVGDPGGAGIGGPRNNWTAPSWWHNYAHGPGQPSYDGQARRGPLHLLSTDQSGDDIRLIFDFVLTQWSGAVADIWEFGYSLVRDKISGVMAITEAIIHAISFYGGQCRPHTDYSSNAGQNYLAGVARTL